MSSYALVSRESMTDISDKQRHYPAVVVGYQSSFLAACTGTGLVPFCKTPIPDN